MEKLSVIIPAYCAERYLSEAVASVRGQHWPGTIEIIIVDDGSVDDTFLAAQRLGDLVLRKKRGGAATARNMGLRAATGSFIVLLDADDVLPTGALEKLHAPFLAAEGTMAVFGQMQDFISPELTPEQKSALRPREGSYGGSPCCALIRRKVFEQIGLFDETLKTGETVAWMLKLRDAGLSVVNLGDITLNRRLHLTNTGRMNAKQELRDYAAILRKRRAGK